MTPPKAIRSITTSFIPIIKAGCIPLTLGGDHTIAIGRVVGADSHPGKMPLIYYRRGYRSLLMD